MRHPEWQPVAGPHHPVERTPERRRPSARRTTSVDVPWPDLQAARTDVLLRGRDLGSPADGNAVATDHLELDLVAELAAGQVLSVSGADEVVEELVGATLRGGFSRHAAGALGDEGPRRTLRASMLDDLAGAFLVSGYSMLRAGLFDGAPGTGPERALHQADVCIGWATGSAMHSVLVEHDWTATPYGPVAPPIEADDPDGWHELAPLAPGSVRRRRQLDVWPDPATGGLGVQAHFRDSYRAEDHEMVLHEYLVHATVDAGGRIVAVDADPRTLPWAECPGAAASASGAVGVALTDVADRVRRELVGPTTCTHLSSTLRSLADVRSLAAQL